MHDILGVAVFLIAFTAIVFFAPEFGGYFLEYNNFIPADPLQDAAHIAPVWYFTPFYSMLRATTDLMVNVLAADRRAVRRAGRAQGAASAACQDRPGGALVAMGLLLGSSTPSSGAWW